MSYQTHPVRRVGGRLCLDFLNTADWSPAGEVLHEKLTDQQDLAIWCGAVGLEKLAGMENPSSLAKLRSFRADLRRLFLSARAGEKPKGRDLARFNRTLEPAMAITPLAMRRGAIAFNKNLSVAQTLALSALSVLTQQSEITRVEVCPSEDCGWLFLDESKNRRRRWCSMETCGNRAKARRHYQRQAEGTSE